MLHSLKLLRLYEDKLFLIQNCVPSRICASCISTFSSLKRHRYEKGGTRREKYQQKMCGIIESNFRYKNVFLQTVGSGAYGAPQSLFVQSHYHRFLFNCGEGTQRIARDNDIECTYFTRLFLTSCSWEHVSGLPGFVIQESRERDEPMPVIRRICGPSGLLNFVDRLSPVFKNPPDEHCLELKSEEINVNDNFLVKAVALFPRGSQISSTKYVLAYICTFPSEPGVVSTQKLVDADVPPGPLVNDLRNGLPVTLPDGRIVTPSDVSNYQHKSSSFIVLEIPNVEYLDALISSPDFDKYKKGTGLNPEENDLKVIVHFSPPEVMKVSGYRQWVNSFSPSVSHMVINNRSSCSGLQDSIKMHLQLNHIMPKVFPQLRNPGIPFVSSGSDISTEEETPNIPFTSEYKFDGPTVQSNTALRYSIRPDEQFESSFCPQIDPNQFTKDWEEEPLILNSIKDLKEVINKLDGKNNSSCQDSYPSVLFLGTGASFSTGARNDSGILIKVRPNNFFMLDCGKGTLNQLIRLMGEEETKSTLRDLKLVFISHVHQDHHMGLPAMINERRKAFLEAGVKNPPPLYLLLPQDVHEFLENIRFCFDLDTQNVVFLNNVKLTGDYENLLYKYKKVAEYLGLERLSTARVQHVKYSYGIALHHQDDWKIVYSGDCRPSKNLIEIGRNCDLLIHEATFEDELLDDAKRTSHSTVSEAIAMGKNMNAKFTILTHFSQRYRKLPLLNDSMSKENVGIAFDYMKVNFQDLPYLRHMYPTLKEIFYKDHEISEARRYRRIHFPEFKQLRKN